MTDRLRMNGLRALVWAFAAAMAVLASCSGGQRDESEVVGKTAKLYYEYLLQGKYEAYVDGFFRPDSIPGGYRSQLTDNARMFVGQQNTEHKGIKTVDVGSVSVDTARHAANVFLILGYGDGVSEQVVVPMIQDNGVWMMR